MATALVGALACAFSGPAAAEVPGAEGVVIESLSGSKAALSFWTKARRERAEPLSVLTLPGSPPPEAGPPSPGPTPSSSEAAETDPSADESVPSSDASNPSLMALRTASLAGASTAATATVGGTEVNAAESVFYPNSTNGKIYGEYRSAIGRELYQCSGSVINSVRGNVILTAGHCVINPETGTVGNNLIFIPGYRQGPEPMPFGSWVATAYASPEAWKKTAKAGLHPNEGVDLALLVLADNEEHKSVEEVVGGLGIAFNQACNQTYTQFGYPAEAPYDGETLYSHVAPYAGPDTNPLFSPVPMKIASDFTQGASGGPWTIGPSTSPTVLSLTDYGYEEQPGWLYGAYFGEAARKTYESASGKVVPAGIEEACQAPPPAPAVPTPAPPAPPPEVAPPKAPVTLKLTRIHRRANGSAVLTAKVSRAGRLKLTGADVRAEKVNAPAAGKYRLIVAAKGPTIRRLARRGRAKVGVKVAFRASGKVRRVKRAIRLNRRSARHHARQHAHRTG